jgi:UDP-glucose 4-epimerase
VHHDARNEVTHAYSDHSKVAGVFGEPEGVSLEEGVGRMVAWAQEHGPRGTSTIGEIEVERNLPPSWADRAPAAKEV